MHSPNESNTQHDQPATQTQLNDDFPEEEDPTPEEQQSWGRLVSRSADGPHVDLLSSPPDEEGRYNMQLCGRSNQCTLQFNQSPRISNKHCIIYCKQNIADPNNPRLEAWIEDLSANGTFINGENRLTKNVPRLLHHRDEIFLINPELQKLAKAGAKIIEDIARNSFVVMLNLPSPVDEFVLASRDYDMQLSQNDGTMPSSQGAFSGITRIERSSTVNRLLNQKRSIYDFYEIKALLGEGTSGHVYHGINKETGKDWAIKIIPTKNLNLQANVLNNQGKANNELTKEAEMLRSLRHPHIIHLEDIFADNKRLFLVMEMSSGGDLFDRIVKKKYYTEPEAKVVMTQILQAMAYLHERNIAHRDIKPENILLVNKHSDVDIKLTDFGLAKKVDESGKMKTFCGTPQYFAPEVLQRRNTMKGAGTYSLAADMWSLGVILFVLLEGNYPFQENTLSQQINAAQYSFAAPIWKRISDEAKNLIRSLLVIDPNARLTAQQALQCEWLTSPSNAAPANGSAAVGHQASNGNTRGSAEESNGHGSQVPPSNSRSTVEDTAMRTDTMNTTVTNITNTTDVTVNNALQASADVSPRIEEDAALAVSNEENPYVPRAASRQVATDTAQRVKQSVLETLQRNASAMDIDCTSAMSAGGNCMSITTAVQFELEKVNLNNVSEVEVTVDVSTSERSSGSSRKGARKPQVTTKRITASAVVAPTTGKRKLSATAQAATPNTSASSASNMVSPSKGAAAVRRKEAGSASASKKTRVMENYFAKQASPAVAAAGSSSSGAEGSPVKLARRITRSASTYES